MPFNSINYFLFLPGAYLAFRLAGERLRWLVLLAASFGFYLAADAPYLLGALLLVILLTYAAGLKLGPGGSPRARSLALWGGITGNLAILILLKYQQFLCDNLQLLASLFSWRLQLPRPEEFAATGVSYYVVQAISYLSDLYLELEEPEQHLGYLALYLAFFPKLLHGPIERAGDLLPQLKEKFRFDYDNVRFGMLLIAWGLFKKLVLADRLGLYVDPVYADVHAHSGPQLLLATYTYALQIYLDFSGYTDMALGSARLFNVRLTQNFNAPYLATSVADFWRRWHISFSRWILDYIFRPLQMRWRDWRTWGTAAAIMVAFLVSGLWHGASYGFVIWGALHGLYLACSAFYRPYQKKLHRALGLQKSRLLTFWRVFVTFNLVSFAWIFFRADTVQDAFFVVRRLFSFEAGGAWLPSFELKHYLVVLVLLPLVALGHYGAKNERLMRLYREHAAFRTLLYFILSLLILNLAVSATTGFIYGTF